MLPLCPEPCTVRAAPPACALPGAGGCAGFGGCASDPAVMLEVGTGAGMLLVGGYERAMSALSIMGLCSLGGSLVVLYCLPCSSKMGLGMGSRSSWLGPCKGGQK